MNLASSSYYYKPKTDVNGQARRDAELRDHIERIQGEFAGYGYRRLGKQLRRVQRLYQPRRIDTISLKADTQLVLRVKRRCRSAGLWRMTALMCQLRARLDHSSRAF